MSAEDDVNKLGLPFDREAYNQVRSDEAKSIRDSQFILTGADFEALKFACTLARRCFDRDPHFEDIEKPIADVLGKMRQQWRETPEGKMICAKLDKLLGLERGDD